MDRLAMETVGAAMLFSTSHHAKSFPEIIHSIRSKTHARALIGATGSGIIGPRGEIENSPGISILLISADRVTSGAALIPRLDSPDAVEQLRSELPSLYRERGTLFVAADPKSLHPEFFDRLARMLTDTPVVGVVAGWCTPDQTASLIADADTSTRGGTAIHIAGNLEPSVGVAQAVIPESDPAPITRSRGNVIQEIDSKPAADMLTDFIENRRAPAGPGESSDIYCTIADSKNDFENGRYIVRNILGVDLDSKEVTIAEVPRAGQSIAFGKRSPKNSRRSFRQMLERLNGGLSARVPRAAVIFNCCARGQLLYGRPHVDLDAFHEFFPDLPIAGLFGFAEIGPIFWDGRKIKPAIFNHTAVLTLLNEPMEALGTA